MPYCPLRPRVPGVYLTWAIPVYLAFFAFSRMNNLRPVSVRAEEIAGSQLLA
jgi:hypothetical protein